MKKERCLYLRDVFARNAEQQNFRLFCPDETNWQIVTSMGNETRSMSSPGKCAR
jgi:phosphoketolase